MVVQHRNDVEIFLIDNGFSVKASSSPFTYIKDVTRDLGKAGNLHAHIKVVFTNDNLQEFDLHGTVRTQKDANALGVGNFDSDIQGRAIWVYYNQKQRSPADHKYWLTKGGTTYPELMGYCRKLAKLVSEWSIEISKQGCNAYHVVPKNAQLIKQITLWGQ